MSWTIESIENSSQTELENAVKAAYEDGILLFSACDDQGNTSGHPYPAKNNETNMFKIGCATTLGLRHKTINKNFFDYIAPGLEEARHVPDNSNLTAPEKPLFGSSIATARCAGLAAMILQCIVLVYNPQVWHNPKDKPKKYKLEMMQMMFGRMVDKEDSNNYIRVWEIFERAMNQSSMVGDLEGNIIKTIAGEFGKSIPGQPEMTAPHV